MMSKYERIVVVFSNTNLKISYQFGGKYYIWQLEEM